MTLFETLSLVGVTHFAAVSSPGPDMMLVMNRSMRQGYAGGFRTLAGILVSTTCHLILIISGLVTISGNHDWLEHFKPVAAILLVLMGAKTIYGYYKRPKLDPQQMTAAEGAGKSKKSLFITGFVTDFFNPNVLMYYFTIFTTVSLAERTSWERVAMVIMMLTIALSCFSAIIVISARSSKGSGVVARILAKTEPVFGAALILMGIACCLS